MTRDDVFTLVADFFVTKFEVPRERIVPEARLYEDLELDSIDALDMIAMLESQVGVTVDEASIRKVRTVDDVVTYVVSRLPAQPS